MSDFLRPFAVSYRYFQVIIFDQLDQPVGVGSVCCVSAFLQTSCPTFIVGYFQFEQRGITGTVDQKTGVVFVRLFGFLYLRKHSPRRSSSWWAAPTPPVRNDIWCRSGCSQLRASSLRPAPDSNNPCASVILAGIRYFFWCWIAKLLYCLIYFSYAGTFRWLAPSAVPVTDSTNNRERIRNVNRMTDSLYVIIFNGKDN